MKKTKLTPLFLAVQFFIGQGIFAYSAESNLWAERNAETQLAMLPTHMRTHPSLMDPTTFQKIKHTEFKHLLNKPQNHPQLIDLLSVIPAHLGTIRKIHLPHNTIPKKHVFFINDIHQNTDAQTHISEVIQLLIQNKRIKKVALEGAFAPLGWDSLHQFTHPDLLPLSADFLLQEKEISGPLHASIITRSPHFFVGIDDEKLYTQNVDAVLQSNPKSEKVKQKLSQQLEELTKKKTALFNFPLLQFDRIVQQYQNNEISLVDYLGHISKHTTSFSPQSEIFLSAVQLEKNINSDKLQHERVTLFSELTRVMTKKEQQQLLHLGMAFKAQQINHRHFYKSLQTLCERHNISLTPFPEFRSYLQYIQLAHRVKGDALHQEIAQLEKEILNNLVHSPAESEILAQSRKLSLQNKLIDFSLTQREWQELNSHSDNSYESWKNFYVSAQARDQAMAENIQTVLKEGEISTIVLVAGGFHAQGLIHDLNQNGIGVVSFIPRMSKVESDSGSQYLSLFAQEKTPLEQIIAGDKLFLAPRVGTPAQKLNLVRVAAALGYGWGQIQNVGTAFKSAFPLSRLQWTASKSLNVVELTATNALTKLKNHFRLEIDINGPLQILDDVIAQSKLTQFIMWMMGIPQWQWAGIPFLPHVYHAPPDDRGGSPESKGVSLDDPVSVDLLATPRAKQIVKALKDGLNNGQPVTVRMLQNLKYDERVLEINGIGESALEAIKIYLKKYYGVELKPLPAILRKPRPRGAKPPKIELKGLNEKIATPRIIFRDLMLINIHLFNTISFKEMPDGLDLNQADMDDVDFMDYDAITELLEEYSHQVLNPARKKGFTLLRNEIYELIHGNEEKKGTLQLLKERKGLAAQTKLVAAYERAGREYLENWKVKLSRARQYKKDRPKFRFERLKGLYLFLKGNYEYGISHSRSVPLKLIQDQEFKTLWEAFRGVDHQIDNLLNDEEKMKDTDALLKEVEEKLMELKSLQKDKNFLTHHSELLADLSDQVLALNTNLKSKWIVEKQLGLVALQTTAIQIRFGKISSALSLIQLGRRMIQMRLEEDTQMIEWIEKSRLTRMRDLAKDRIQYLHHKFAALRKSYNNIIDGINGETSFDTTLTELIDELDRKKRINRAYAVLQESAVRITNHPKRDDIIMLVDSFADHLESQTVYVERIELIYTVIVGMININTRFGDALNTFMDEARRLEEPRQEPDYKSLHPILKQIKNLFDQYQYIKGNGSTSQEEKLENAIGKGLSMGETRAEAAAGIYWFMEKYRVRFKELRRLGVAEKEAKLQSFHESFKQFANEHDVQLPKETGRVPREFTFWYWRLYQAAFIPLNINHPEEKKKRVPNPRFDAFSTFIDILEVDDIKLVRSAAFIDLKNQAPQTYQYLGRLKKKRVFDLDSEEKRQVIEKLSEDFSAHLDVSVSEDDILRPYDHFKKWRKFLSNPNETTREPTPRPINMTTSFAELALHHGLNLDHMGRRSFLEELAYAGWYINTIWFIANLLPISPPIVLTINFMTFLYSVIKFGRDHEDLFAWDQKRNRIVLIGQASVADRIKFALKGALFRSGYLLAFFLPIQYSILALLQALILHWFYNEILVPYFGYYFAMAKKKKSKPKNGQGPRLAPLVPNPSVNVHFDQAILNDAVQSIYDFYQSDFSDFSHLNWMATHWPGYEDELEKVIKLRRLDGDSDEIILDHVIYLMNDEIFSVVGKIMTPSKEFKPNTPDYWHGIEFRELIREEGPYRFGDYPINVYVVKAPPGFLNTRHTYIEVFPSQWIVVYPAKGNEPFFTGKMLGKIKDTYFTGILKLNQMFVGRLKKRHGNKLVAKVTRNSIVDSVTSRVLLNTPAPADRNGREGNIISKLLPLRGKNNDDTNAALKWTQDQMLQPEGHLNDLYDKKEYLPIDPNLADHHIHAAIKYIFTQLVTAYYRNDLDYDLASWTHSIADKSEILNPAYFYTYLIIHEFHRRGEVVPAPFTNPHIAEIYTEDQFTTESTWIEGLQFLADQSHDDMRSAIKAICDREFKIPHYLVTNTMGAVFSADPAEPQPMKPTIRNPLYWESAEVFITSMQNMDGQPVVQFGEKLDNNEKKKWEQLFSGISKKRAELASLDNVTARAYVLDYANKNWFRERGIVLVLDENNQPQAASFSFLREYKLPDGNKNTIYYLNTPLQNGSMTKRIVGGIVFDTNRVEDVYLGLDAKLREMSDTRFPPRDFVKRPEFMTAFKQLSSKVLKAPDMRKAQIFKHMIVEDLIWETFQHQSQIPQATPEKVLKKYAPENPFLPSLMNAAALSDDITENNIYEEFFEALVIIKKIILMDYPHEVLQSMAMNLVINNVANDHPKVNLYTIAIFLLAKELGFHRRDHTIDELIKTSDKEYAKWLEKLGRDTTDDQLKMAAETVFSQEIDFTFPIEFYTAVGHISLDSFRNTQMREEGTLIKTISNSPAPTTSEIDIDPQPTTLELDRGPLNAKPAQQLKEYLKKKGLRGKFVIAIDDEPGFKTVRGTDKMAIFLTDESIQKANQMTSAEVKKRNSNPIIDEIKDVVPTPERLQQLRYKSYIYDAENKLSDNNYADLTPLKRLLPLVPNNARATFQEMIENWPSKWSEITNENVAYLSHANHFIYVVNEFILRHINISVQPLVTSSGPGYGNGILINRQILPGFEGNPLYLYTVDAQQAIEDYDAEESGAISISDGIIFQAHDLDEQIDGRQSIRQAMNKDTYNEINSKIEAHENYNRISGQFFTLTHVSFYFIASQLEKFIGKKYGVTYGNPDFAADFLAHFIEEENNPLNPLITDIDAMVQTDPNQARITLTQLGSMDLFRLAAILSMSQVTTDFKFLLADLAWNLAAPETDDETFIQPARLFTILFARKLDIPEAQFEMTLENIQNVSIDNLTTWMVQISELSPDQFKNKAKNIYASLFEHDIPAEFFDAAKALLFSDAPPAVENEDTEAVSPPSSNIRVQGIEKLPRSFRPSLIQFLEESELGDQFIITVANGRNKTNISIPDEGPIQITIAQGDITEEKNVRKTLSDNEEGPIVGNLRNSFNRQRKNAIRSHNKEFLTQVNKLRDQGSIDFSSLKDLLFHFNHFPSLANRWISVVNQLNQFQESDLWNTDLPKFTVLLNDIWFSDLNYLLLLQDKNEPSSDSPLVIPHIRRKVEVDMGDDYIVDAIILDATEKDMLIKNQGYVEFEKRMIVSEGDITILFKQLSELLTGWLKSVNQDRISEIAYLISRFSQKYNTKNSKKKSQILDENIRGHLLTDLNQQKLAQLLMARGFKFNDFSSLESGSEDKVIQVVFKKDSPIKDLLSAAQAQGNSPYVLGNHILSGLGSTALSNNPFDSIEMNMLTYILNDEAKNIQKVDNGILLYLLGLEFEKSPDDFNVDTFLNLSYEDYSRYLKIINGKTAEEINSASRKIIERHFNEEFQFALTTEFQQLADKMLADLFPQPKPVKAAPKASPKPTRAPPSSPKPASTDKKKETASSKPSPAAKKPTKRKPTTASKYPGDLEFAEIIRQEKGNAAQVARRLHVLERTIHDWVNPKKFPDRLWLKMLMREERFRNPDRDELKALIQRHFGNRDLMAEELGISPDAIDEFLENEDELKKLAESLSQVTPNIDWDDIAPALGLLADDPGRLFNVLMLFYADDLSHTQVNQLTQAVVSGLEVSRSNPINDFDVEIQEPEITVHLSEESLIRNKYHTENTSVRISGKVNSNATHIHIGGAYRHTMKLDTNGAFDFTLPITKIGRQSSFTFTAVNPKDFKRSPTHKVTVLQTSPPERTTTALTEIFDFHNDILKHVKSSKKSRIYLMRSLEISYLIHFTQNESDGFEFLRHQIETAKSEEMKDLLKEIEIKFQNVEASYREKLDPLIRKKNILGHDQRIYFFQKYVVYEVMQMKNIFKASTKDEKSNNFHKRGILLAIEQGLGKTLISLLLSLEEDAVVITPKSLISTWIEQARNFLMVNLFESFREGSHHQRDAKLESIYKKHGKKDAEPHTIVQLLFNKEFTSQPDKNRRLKPSILQAWRDRLRKIARFGKNIIIDEMHFLGNPGSDQTIGIQELIQESENFSPDSFVTMLSATPFRKPEDILNILRFVSNDPIIKDGNLKAEDVIDLTNSDGIRFLHLLLFVYSIRIRKKDVFYEYSKSEEKAKKEQGRLPYKDRHDVKYKLSPTQIDMLFMLFTNFPKFAQTLKDKTGKIIRDGNKTREQWAQRIMADPSYVDPTLTRTDSPKYSEMDDIIRKHMADPNSKILVFTEFREEVQKYVETYAEEFGALSFYGKNEGFIYESDLKGIESNGSSKKGSKVYFKVDPLTEEYLSDDEGELIRTTNKKEGRPITKLDYHRFLLQNSKNHRILFATEDQGAFGYTFTAANVVIFDERSESYRNQYQAEDRAHRIDPLRDKRKVDYYYLMGEYDKKHINNNYSPEEREAYFSMGTYQEVYYGYLKMQKLLFDLIMDLISENEDDLDWVRNPISQKMPFLFPGGEEDNQTPETVTEETRMLDTDKGDTWEKLAGLFLAPDRTTLIPEGRLNIKPEKGIDHTRVDYYDDEDGNETIYEIKFYNSVPNVTRTMNHALEGIDNGLNTNTPENNLRHHIHIPFTPEGRQNPTKYVIVTAHKNPDIEAKIERKNDDRVRYVTLKELIYEREKSDSLVELFGYFQDLLEAWTENDAYSVKVRRQVFKQWERFFFSLSHKKISRDRRFKILQKVRDEVEKFERRAKRSPTNGSLPYFQPESLFSSILKHGDEKQLPEYRYYYHDDEGNRQFQSYVEMPPEERIQIELLERFNDMNPGYQRDVYDQFVETWFQNHPSEWVNPHDPQQKYGTFETYLQAKPYIWILDDVAKADKAAQKEAGKRELTREEAQEQLRTLALASQAPGVKKIISTSAKSILIGLLMWPFIKNGFDPQYILMGLSLTLPGMAWFFDQDTQHEEGQKIEKVIRAVDDHLGLEKSTHDNPPDPDVPPLPNFPKYIPLQNQIERRRLTLKSV